MRVYRATFLIFLVWVPIPLGSNRPVFWVLNAAILMGLYVLAWADDRNRRQRGIDRASSWQTLLFLIPLGWMLVQAVRVAPAMLQYIPDLPGALGSGAISVSPALTLEAATRYVAITLALALAIRAGSRGKRRRELLYAVVASGLVVAIYGLAAARMGWDQNFLSSSSDRLTSFFVNPDSTATFIDLALVATVALSMANLEKVGTQKWVRTLSEMPYRIGFPLLVVGVLGTALLETGSRAGIAAGAVGVGTAWAFAYRRTAARHQTVFGLCLGVAAAVFLALSASSVGFIDRLGDLDFAGGPRTALYLDTLRAISERPLLGYGAGTFAQVFPLFHGPDVASGVVWLEAHNAYLQLAVELGVPAAIGILFAVAVLVWRCGASIVRRTRPAPAAVAAVAATAVVAVHSMFDFSLQIEAVAILFVVLLGAGVAEAGRWSNRQGIGPRTSATREYENRAVELVADV